MLRHFGIYVILVFACVCFGSTIVVRTFVFVVVVVVGVVVFVFVLLSFCFPCCCYCFCCCFCYVVYLSKIIWGDCHVLSIFHVFVTFLCYVANIIRANHLKLLSRPLPQILLKN